jgi:CRISPR-associated protein Cmr6
MPEAVQLTSTLPADTVQVIKPKPAWSDFDNCCDSRSLMLDRYAQPQLKEGGRKAFFENAIRRKALTQRCKSWDALLPKLAAGGSILYAQVQSRLLVNIAGGVMENAGLCLDRFGMPYIPGSAVKGCARRMAIQRLLEAREKGGPVVSELAKLLADIVLVFGAGELDWSDEKTDENPVSDFAWALGAQDAWTETKKTARHQLLDYLDLEDPTPSSKNVPDLAGHVGFLPAYPVQVSIADLPIRCPNLGALELDVGTCHHSKYYSAATERAIAFDDEEPIPVIFPAVAPGHVFAFVIVPLRGNHRSFSQPGKLLQTLARDWLAGGLNTFGLGAKTAAGYGWFAIAPEIGAAVENQRQVRAAAEQEQRKAQADRERQRREEEKKRLDREAYKKATAGMSEEEKQMFLLKQWTDDQLRSKLARWNQLSAPEKNAFYQLLRGEKSALWRELRKEAEGKDRKGARWRPMVNDLFKMAKDRKEKMP